MWVCSTARFFLAKLRGLISLKYLENRSCDLFQSGKLKAIKRLRREPSTSPLPQCFEPSADTIAGVVADFWPFIRSQTSISPEKIGRGRSIAFSCYAQLVVTWHTCGFTAGSDEDGLFLAKIVAIQSTVHQVYHLAIPFPAIDLYKLWPRIA